MQTHIFSTKSAQIGARSSPCLQPRPIVCKAARAERDEIQASSIGLAAMVALSAGLTSGPMLINAAPAWADEGAELTPYEKRQQESERRRQLLREAREKAEQNNPVATAALEEADRAVERANEQRRNEANSRKLSVQTYEQDAAKGIKAPPTDPYANSPLNFSLPPPPEKLSDIKVPDFKSFKFEAPSFETPEPAKPAPPVKAAPAPAPVVSKPTPAKEVTNAGKRRGPLPLFLAQVVVLALIGGVGAAATKYNEQSTKALNAAGEFVVQGYAKLEAATAGKK